LAAEHRGARQPRENRQTGGGDDGIHWPDFDKDLSTQRDAARRSNSPPIKGGGVARFPQAGEIFQRMLWLNPSDNQGVRFLIDEVRDGVAWR